MENLVTLQMEIPSLPEALKPPTPLLPEFNETENPLGGREAADRGGVLPQPSRFDLPSTPFELPEELELPESEGRYTPSWQQNVPSEGTNVSQDVPEVRERDIPSWDYSYTVPSVIESGYDESWHKSRSIFWP